MVFCLVDSMKHVPGFVEKAEEFKSKGVDEILLISGISVCSISALKLISVSFQLVTISKQAFLKSLCIINMRSGVVYRVWVNE